MAIIEAVFTGMVAMIVATVPRNLLFLANLKVLPGVPWAVPLVALLLWLFWRYMGGAGPPADTAEVRRARLRAAPLAPGIWVQGLAAGALGIVTLVLLLRLVNRFVAFPEQQAPDLSQVPLRTVVPMLVLSSLFAGVVEEASFRGYMQGPIERSHGPVVAILITGVMFAVAHLDFTPVLLPYYVAVAAIYGTVTFFTNSILPAIVLHTAGNLYSNTDLWLRGRSEWQTAQDGHHAGIDQTFWVTIAAALALAGATLWLFQRLARSTRT